MRGADNRRTVWVLVFVVVVVGLSAALSGGTELDSLSWWAGLGVGVLIGVGIYLVASRARRRGPGAGGR